MKSIENSFWYRYAYGMKKYVLLILFFLSLFLSLPVTVYAAPSVSGVTDNRSSYSGSQVPKYEKFEITFQVSTTSQNPYVPYDNAPPPGVTPALGVTVNGLFLPQGQTDWTKAYVQPAFYYQDFDYQQISGKDYFYPKNDFSWRVRFAPTQTGTWNYKLKMQDSAGTYETPTATSFIVSENTDSVHSTRKGFIRVSQTDPRYFEYEDGTFFPATGTNMTWKMIDWDSPVKNNSGTMSSLGSNGMQFIRFWLSDWGIWGPRQGLWSGMFWQNLDFNADELGVWPTDTRPGSDVAFHLVGHWQPCIVLGLGGSYKEAPAVKKNTTYKVLVRYRIPQALPQPNGAFTVKMSPSWIGPPDCASSTVAHPAIISATETGSTTGQWKVASGTFTTDSTGAAYKPMDRLYLTLENVNDSGSYAANIDRIEVREVLPGQTCDKAVGEGNLMDISNGNCGVNIISSSWAALHQTVDQKYAISFDKVLDLAKQNNVYLRPVILDKNTSIFNFMNPNGTMMNNDNFPGNDHFYGDYRTMTKVRWHHQTWWRYLQARWGYSTNIHSWELLNEGADGDSRHWTQADEFAKYMHQFTPNHHMANTSTDKNFPGFEFWANPNYPNIDFADVHAYISTGFLGSKSIHESDAAAFHIDYATEVRSTLNAAARDNNVPNKPVVRGETGIDTASQQAEQSGISSDTRGVWLHTLLWSGLNNYPMMEQYWWQENTFSKPGPDGQTGLFEVYKYYYDFLKNIPLSNGKYGDAGATSNNNTNLRVIGQKDITNGRAHLWVQNKNFTWKNVVNGTNNYNGISGTVTIPGFVNHKGTSLPVEWTTFTAQGLPTITTSSVSVGNDTNGTITLSLPVGSTVTDAGIKIGDYSTVLPPTATPGSSSPTPTPILGDINHDSKVNTTDLLLVLTKYALSGVSGGEDINQDGKVNMLDAGIVIKNWTL